MVIVDKRIPELLRQRGRERIEARPGGQDRQSWGASLRIRLGSINPPGYATRTVHEIDPAGATGLPMTEHLRLLGAAHDEDAIARTAEALAGRRRRRRSHRYRLRARVPLGVRRLRQPHLRAQGAPRRQAAALAHPRRRRRARLRQRGSRGPRRKLIDRFWPGPLTLVLGDEPHTVALRLPDHDAAARDPAAGGRSRRRDERERVRAASGRTSAEEVARSFEGRVDLVLDGGAAPLGRESTIVRVLSRRPDRRCCGKVTCPERSSSRRSPGRSCSSARETPAGARWRPRSLARDLAEALGVPPAGLAARGFHVGSAGILAAAGNPASPGAVEAARRTGLSLDSHRTRQITGSHGRGSGPDLGDVLRAPAAPPAALPGPCRARSRCSIRQDGTSATRSAGRPRTTSPASSASRLSCGRACRRSPRFRVPPQNA